MASLDGVNFLWFTIYVGIWPFLVLFLVKYLWRPWTIHRALQRQGFKGNRPLFMMGDLLHIADMVHQQMRSPMPSISHDINNRVFPYFVKWANIYGEKFVIWFGYEPRIVVSDAQIAKQLLSSKHLSDTGRSPLIQKMLSVAFGKGLVTVNGHKWSQQRRVVAPAFHTEKLKASVDIMCVCTAELVDEWNKIIAKATERPCKVELTDYMDKHTAHIFMRVMFGMDYNKQGKELYDDIRRLEELMIQNFRHLWMPCSRYIPTPTNLEIWKRTRRLERNLKRMIQQRRDAGSYGNDLLDMMLCEIDKVSKEDKDFCYSLQQVMDDCKTFFLAGRETTSVLLSWTILLLALNQDWQDKGRQEAIAVCGNGNPTMDSLSKLKIIGMILNEGLRLYPPAAGIVRQAFRDLRLGKDLVIPKGVNVVVDILLMHRNPKYWGNDANEFRPERFKDGIAKATGNHPSAFLPFSSGPRVCIGQNFAMLEAKIVMVTLLKSFRFHVDSSYRHAPVGFVTINPQHGIPIIVETTDLR